MKVGIVTFHTAINYGAVLQALALQETLSSLSDSVEIVNYESDEVVAIYHPFSLRKYKRLFRNSVRGVVRSLASDLLHGWRVMRKNRNFQKFFKAHYRMSEVSYRAPVELSEATVKYDACFAGSDQIWNPDITRGFDSVYFLNFGHKNMIRASYAASIGRDSFSEEESAILKQELERFDAISLRERSAVDVVAPLCAVAPVISLDPTLLLTAEQWNRKLKKGSPQKGRYIFVYELYQNPELKKIAEAVSKKHKLPIVTVNMKKTYEGEVAAYGTAGPEDWVALLAGADFVVTNSFHGTAFSINFSKQFVTVLGKKRNSRVLDLLSSLGIKNRAVFNYDDLEFENPPIDYMAVQERLNEARARSKAYIQGVLERKEV